MLTSRERLITLAAGAAVTLAIAALVAGAVGPLLWAGAGAPAAGSASFDAYVWRIARFTVLQAVLSTVLSVVLALPVASALARRQVFPGRAWLVRCLTVPLGLPQIVACLGIIEIWGREGLVNSVWAATGLGPPLSIYGLSGILIAHVFFNMPLCARLMLLELERIPVEYWALAASLGMRRRDSARLIEGPALARILPGMAGLVFMLCATSFTVVLLLGGGPAATTLEVAIYQALHFDFDPPRAIALALLQIALTSVVLVLLRLVGGTAPQGFGLARAPVRRDPDSGLARAGDATAIGLAAAFLLAPLIAVLTAGLAADLTRLAGERIVWQAFATSLAIAAAAAFLALAATLVLAAARDAATPLAANAAARAFRAAAGAATSLILLVPPIVLGAGWFLALHDHIDMMALAPAVIILVNALMALPFVIRVTEPALVSHRRRTERLALSLGLTGWRRLRIVDWPVLRRPLSIAFAFAMALSLGDLGAVALFGGPNTVTLPYLLLQRMGSYRTRDAAGIALMLGVLCLALMLAGTREQAPERRAS